MRIADVPVSELITSDGGTTIHNGIPVVAKNVGEILGMSEELQYKRFSQRFSDLIREKYGALLKNLRKEFSTTSKKEVELIEKFREEFMGHQDEFSEGIEKIVDGDVLHDKFLLFIYETGISIEKFSENIQGVSTVLLIPKIKETVEQLRGIVVTYLELLTAMHHKKQ